MKSVFFVAFLALIASSQAHLIHEKDAKLQGFAEDLLNSSINALLSGLSDPFTVGDVKLDFSNNTVLDGSFNLSGLSLAGVKKVVASYINVTLLNMGLNMTINAPEITLKTTYGADVDVASLVPLYGNGDAEVTLKGLRLNVSGVVSLFPLGVKNVTVIFTMDGANFNIGGLLNNPEFSILVNQMLTDNVVPFIDNNQELVSGLISGVVQDILNSVLKGATTDEVFKVTRESIKNSRLREYVTIN